MQTNNIFSKILGSAWGVDCAALQELIDPLFKVGSLCRVHVQMCVAVLTWAILQEYNDTLTQLCTQYNTTCSGYPGVSNCQTCSATSDVSVLKQTVPAPHFVCAHTLVC